MKYNSNDDMTRLKDSFISLFDSFNGEQEASDIAYEYVSGAWNFISSSSDKSNPIFLSIMKEAALDLHVR